MFDAKPIILSGVQATGHLHIGNYLGAVKQFLDLQAENKQQGFYFVADLHALTVPRDPVALKQSTYEVVAEYIAAGLDPEKSTIFLQSHVPAHAELAWIFNCLTPMGELERMTQYKDKAARPGASVNVGLFDYPVLMAADILLYKPASVPVGEDQLQHLELARIIARKFNNQFGETFPEPKATMLKPVRVMSLQDPEKKMSKTGDEPLYLDDEPEAVTKKIMKAVTATGADGDAPGVRNLMMLMQVVAKPEVYDIYQTAVADESVRYSEMKTALAESYVEFFSEFRQKKNELLANTDYLDEILATGASKAAEIANVTLKEVKEKIGLI